MKKNKPYQIDGKEEIFWILLSFFAMEYEKQKRIEEYFSLTEFSSSFNGKVCNEMLETLVWCYNRYLPDMEENIYQPSIELYALFKILRDHSIMLINEGYTTELIFDINEMETNEIWNLIRRMARLILKEWGISSYNLPKRLTWTM